MGKKPRAMASEFAAVLDDPEHDDAFAARGTGARIFIAGEIENADVDKSQPNGGSLDIKLDIAVMALQAKLGWTAPSPSAG
ncbi:MAG TPA: hypothetical protein VNK24_00680 [Elusimicrobiota bacterium]|nr:hypothetical protein [Elusimicrobiota bacterium]